MTDAVREPVTRTHATMADVAKAAGVSLKSVSRVINKEPHVTDALRAKVEAAIRELAYVPDTAARSLAGARSFTIGVLFDNPSPNYTMKVLAGAYSACIEHQYHLRIDTIDTSADTATLNAVLEAIFRHSRSDGFVLTPPVSDDPRVLAALDRHGARYSRLAPMVEHGEAMAVMIDDAAAAARVADMFLDLGHRRFGLVNGPDNHGAAHQRRTGFLDRLAQRDPSLVVEEAFGGFQFERGIEAGRQLLARDQRPTAIFATNDDSAAGVIIACNQMGLAVPRDISVCGFDDSWVARTVWPYLTTIHQPIEAMARVAARMIIARGDSNPEVRTQQLDFELVMRDSVAPVPA